MSEQSTFEPVLRTARSRMTRRDQRGFYADLEDSGLRPDVTTDIDPARLAPDDVATLLGVAVQTPVLARQRRMSTNGTALQLATTYFAPVIAAELPQLGEHNTGPGGMYARMEDAGHQLEQTDEVTSRLATPRERDALRLTEDETVILITRLTRDADTGTVLEVTKVTAAASRNRFVYAI
jgi:GntR family transcriptional regulator